MGRAPLICLAPLVAMVLQGCAGTYIAPVEISARESVLVEERVRYGRLSGDPATLMWEGGGLLQLTPTTLYLTYGRNQRTISYSIVHGVSAASVQPWRPWPLAAGTSIEDQLVLQTTRPTCLKGCVFGFDMPAKAHEVAALIAARRSGVDAFGRLASDPGPVWLATGFRGAPIFWKEKPVYLESNFAAELERFEARFPAWQSAVGDAYARSIAAGPDSVDYPLRKIEGIDVNHRTELLTAGALRTLRAADPTVKRLLVTDLTGFVLSEKFSMEGSVRPQVEVTVEAFVDFYDVDPLKDGAYFVMRHTVVRPLSEWLAMDDSAFALLAAEAAAATTERIRQTLD